MTDLRCGFDHNGQGPRCVVADHHDGPHLFKCAGASCPGYPWPASAGLGALHRVRCHPSYGAEGGRCRWPPKLDIVPPAARESRARSEETITMLRELLRDAEAGLVDGIMVIAEHDGGELTFHNSRTPNRWETAGKLEWLKQQILSSENE